MRAQDVPENGRDLVFRSSRLHAVVFMLLCVAGCGAMIFYRSPRPPICYIISGVILFGLLLGRRMIAARFHPLNWLVRMSDEGLNLHFRSYLNEHLGTDDPTVVFLPFAEIR